MKQMHWQHQVLRDDDIEKSSVVGLYDEEEDFLEGNGKEGWPSDCIGRIGPDPVTHKVRIPRRGGNDGNLSRQE